MAIHDVLTDRLETFVGRIFASKDLDDANEMADLELTFSQARALMVLSISERPLAINELAQELKLTLASAGRNVHRLVRAGLVEREESCVDRRVKLVSLSSAGVELSRRQHERGRGALQRLIAPLSDNDAQRLLEALAPLLDPGVCKDLSEDRSLTTASS